MNYITLSEQALLALGCSFIFSLLIIFIVRVIVQSKTKKGLRNEIAQRDNFAMGLSYASTLFTVLVVCGHLFKNLNFNDIQANLLHPALLLIFAFSFIMLGKRIHASIILKDFNENRAIDQKNICAALVQSGVLLANGIFMFGLYGWSQPQSLHGILIFSVSFLLLQFFMLVHSRWQEYWFSKSNQGCTLQHQFNFDNVSTGIRYSGQTVGVALAIYAGLRSAPFMADKLVENLLVITAHCGLLIILQQSLSAIAIRFALPRIDTDAEINHQDNIGIACVELAIYIAIGLLLIGLFAV